MYEFLEETVLDNMTSPARTVAPGMTIGDLLRLFDASDLDAFPVVSNGTLVGIVSKADALKAFGPGPACLVPHYDDQMGTTIDEVMSRQVVTVDAKTKLRRVLHLMVVHHFKSLPVVGKDNRLQGIIAREDVIRALARCNRRQTLPLVAPVPRFVGVLALSSALPSCQIETDGEHANGRGGPWIELWRT